jgi:hypothetical protein
MLIAMLFVRPFGIFGRHQVQRVYAGAKLAIILPFEDGAFAVRPFASSWPNRVAAASS